MEKKPDKEKRLPPGADYVDTKKSSRRKKGTKKDESAEAGRSSNLPLQFSAQPGHEPGPSVQKPPTSTGKAQVPAPPGARRPTQNPSQTPQATLPSTRPTQSSAQTGTNQSSQGSSQLDPASSSKKPISTPVPADRLQNRGLAGSNSSAGIVSADAQSGKVSHSDDLSKGGSSDAGRDKTQDAQFVRLRGQPPRPASVARNVYPIDLATNYFPLIFKTGLEIWHYDIKVKPDIKGPKLSQIIKTALKHGDYQRLKTQKVTDFSAIMLSMREIPDEYRNITVSYQTELETQASEIAKEYQITLDPKGPVDVSDLKVGRDLPETYSSALPVEQALDIILGHHRKMSDDVSVIHKRKAFSTNSQTEEYDRGKFSKTTVLTMLRGYFSSVRMSNSSVLVNINVSHGAFYTVPQSLGDVIRWLDRTVDPSKISGLLRGLRVKSSHIPRVWSIWGYPRSSDGRGYMLHPPRFKYPGRSRYTPEEVWFFHAERPKESSTGHGQVPSEQNKRDANDGKLAAHGQCSCPGKWFTVAEYFQTVRMEPIPTQSLGLPLINVGSSKRPTYLPSHLCDIRPGQISNLTLTPVETQDMIKFAVRTPDMNAVSITTKAFNTLGLNSANRELECFGVGVNNDMVRLEGRILTQPKLCYANERVVTLRGSSWNLQHYQFQANTALNNWACVRIIGDPRKDGSIHQDPCAQKLKNFQGHLVAKGIDIKENEDHGDVTIRGNDYRQLEAFFKSSRDDYKVRFLLVVLPTNPSAELYSHIKKYGDLIYGIHTVCVKADKDRNFGSKPYDDNVALKINLKLGGRNHSLDIDSYGRIYQAPSMVVGIDVTHPGPANDDAPSIAAVVASCDRLLAQWPADLRINNRRQEMVEMLQEMLETRLEHFKKSNQQRLPENILIYRDGVGEGQYKIVLEEELPKLRAACRKVYGNLYVPGVRPQISLIVVGKRHHTRFYRTSGNGGDILPGRESNPPCGTLVDNVITQDCNWDFFLQAHTAITGTARPAHYFVLLDEIFASSADRVGELERVTHNLCYLYGKATTSVSIVPAVYYADKACERGRKYLGKVYDQNVHRGNDPVRDSDVKVHDNLKNTMFYI